MMSIWFLLNSVLLIWAIWNVLTGLSNQVTYVHILLGFSGFILFLFNWTRNAVFSTIRNIDSRETKVKLARISKRILPFHRWVGTTALLLIILHGVTVIHMYGFNPANMKISSGLLASVNLLLLVISGWYRLLFNPTLKSRRLHIGLGISMFTLIAVHFVF